jgi:hypothetical protein
VLLLLQSLYISLLVVAFWMTTYGPRLVNHADMLLTAEYVCAARNSSNANSGLREFVEATFKMTWPGLSCLPFFCLFSLPGSSPHTKAHDCHMFNTS